jgi:hypothetical protein
VTTLVREIEVLPPPRPEKTTGLRGALGALAREVRVHAAELRGIPILVKVDDFSRSVGADDLPGAVEVEDHPVADVRNGLLRGFLDPSIRQHVARGMVIDPPLGLGSERARLLAGTLCVWFLIAVVPHDEPL